MYSVTNTFQQQFCKPRVIGTEITIYIGSENNSRNRTDTFFRSSQFDMYVCAQLSHVSLTAFDAVLSKVLEILPALKNGSGKEN